MISDSWLPLQRFYSSGYGSYLGREMIVLLQKDMAEKRRSCGHGAEGEYVVRAMRRAFFSQVLPRQTDGKCRRWERWQSRACVGAVLKPECGRVEVNTTTSAIGETVVPGLPDPASELRVLLVEDEAADVELALRALRQSGLEAVGDIAQTVEEFTDLVRKNSYDVILADYKLPNWNGMESVEVLRREGLDIPVVLVSGALGELTAVDCIKQGASDYVLKDHLARLPEAVRRALREKQLRSEHKQAQEELARSNQDLEQFAYVASHDLQEPLRMVATYTQLLAERYKGKLDADADKYIHYAVDGALRMQKLVQDLLSFSRVGRPGLVVESTDSSAALGEGLQNLGTAMQESGARVDYAQLPVVMADSSQLVQVFQNLVGNAIKFRGSEAPVVGVSAEEKGKEWVFSVADNGIGIAAESVEKVFVIFRRLNTREEYPGNGIGLSICKKIIERHGGRIWVESEIGHGSAFKFTLPVKPIPQQGERTE